MEIIRADIIARYKRAQGFGVFFNTGTDEHGVKIYRNAEKENTDVQAYVDTYAAKFKQLIPALGISPDINFIRTTDAAHVAAAQEFWKKCNENGYISKRTYEVKYCTGCELEKTESELVDDHCPIHPNLALELINEENYFFNLKAFQEKLQFFFNERPDFVIPEFRFNEMKALLARGLDDFSISRLKEKMPWGIPVPDDPTQVMYVWFDALVNYISAIGWPNDMEKFNAWWPVTQYCGKDNIRQQSVMWQAMLLAADLPPSQQIVVNGFINVDGQKMSKSLGNVVNPFDIVEEYGTEALRAYVARELNAFEDSDFTHARFKETYNANLANGLGNLISRTIKMATLYFGGVLTKIDDTDVPIHTKLALVSGEGEIEGFSLSYIVETKILPAYTSGMESFEIKKAADAAWELIALLDRYIADYEPFKLVKTDKDKTEAVLSAVCRGLYTLSNMLLPILPDTALKMQKLLNPVLEGGEIKSFAVQELAEPLFARKE